MACPPFFVPLTSPPLPTKQKKHVVSELPSFVSDRYLVYFDPQAKYLPNINPGNPGKRIDFVKSKVLSQHFDQFSPYCIFNNDMKNPCKGTLFRLALRTQTQVHSIHVRLPLPLVPLSFFSFAFRCPFGDWGSGHHIPTPNACARHGILAISRFVVHAVAYILSDTVLYCPQKHKKRPNKVNYQSRVIRTMTSI